jgi:Ankyrin repeat
LNKCLAGCLIIFRSILKTADITDNLFREAVEAIDSGNLLFLEQLLSEHPELIRRRLDIPKEGYFKEPYLLWFIADNPIRNGKLPPNIVDITKLIIRFVKQEAADSLEHQVNYALGLVETGRIPKECGVQIELIDVLLDAGAKPGKAIGALAHGNKEAAAHVIKRGGEMTLTAAICLEWKDQIEELLKKADDKEKHLALVAASFYGKAAMVELLIQPGANVNGYPESNSGFHSHATALHQAVYAGSLDCVKLLVNGGANLDATDKIYDGTALGWVRHMQEGINDDNDKMKYKAIEEFLLASEKR